MTMTPHCAHLPLPGPLLGGTSLQPSPEPGTGTTLAYSSSLEIRNLETEAEDAGPAAGAAHSRPLTPSPPFRGRSVQHR